MPLRFSDQQLVQLAFLEIEMVFGPDDPDAQMAQRELSSLLQLVSIVEANRLPSVDERHAAGANHLADALANDERGVLVDADAEQLPIRRHDEEQSLQATTLGEVRVDDRVVPE